MSLFGSIWLCSSPKWGLIYMRAVKCYSNVVSVTSKPYFWYNIQVFSDVHTVLCQYGDRSCHTLIALNKNLPLATVMSHCIVKRCRVFVCCCVCQRACAQFGKNRGWVSLKCIVDLVKLLPVLSLTLSLSFCLSLFHHADAKWKRQFPLGVFL